MAKLAVYLEIKAKSGPVIWPLAIAGHKFRQSRHFHHGGLRSAGPIPGQHCSFGYGLAKSKLTPKSFQYALVHFMYPGYGLLSFREIVVAFNLYQIRVAHANKGIVIVQWHFRL